MAKGKKITYTQAGYQKLIDELNYLKLEKREKIKNDIAVARSFGDLSENSEYAEARNEQAKNEARIKELEEPARNKVFQRKERVYPVVKRSHEKTSGDDEKGKKQTVVKDDREQETSSPKLLV